MIKVIALYIWQLPQHLLALCILGALRLFSKISVIERKGGNLLVTVDVPGWGVSLGRYIFMDKRYKPVDWMHESGHSIQSKWLGPLYLLAVGIPSAVFNNLWDRLLHRKCPVEKRQKWYYNRYPEKQADMLGGVIREYPPSFAR